MLRSVGLVIRFLLWVEEVPGSIPDSIRVKVSNITVVIIVWYELNYDFDFTFFLTHRLFLSTRVLLRDIIINIMLLIIQHIASIIVFACEKL